jgi:SNF family Na+-dependent transporter
VRKGWQEGERSLGPRDSELEMSIFDGVICRLSIATSNNATDEFTWLFSTQRKSSGIIQVIYTTCTLCTYNHVHCWIRQYLYGESRLFLIAGASAFGIADSASLFSFLSSTPLLFGSASLKAQGCIDIKGLNFAPHLPRPVAPFKVLICHIRNVSWT